jgi:hypothetical protein
VLKEKDMGYFSDEYDYDTLANDADYIEEYEYEDDYVDDGLQAWENYYHNVKDEIEDE